MLREVKNLQYNVPDGRVRCTAQYESSWQCAAMVAAAADRSAIGVGLGRIVSISDHHHSMIETT